MTTPYRSLFIETDQVRAGAGHCPWCHAAVQFVTTDRMAVCDACDATFATSIALVTDGHESESPAASSSAELVPPIEGVATGRLVMAMLLAFELGLIAIFLFAIGRA